MNTNWTHNGKRYELVTKPYSEEFGQCRYCDFNEIAGGNCPKYGDNEYICDTDETKVWKEVKILKSPTQEIKAFEEPKVNPAVGRKYDSGKAMYNLLPADALEEVVKVLTYGAIKYNEPIDQENWRLVDKPHPRYHAAAQRHQWADWKGEEIDPESGLYHLAHAISSLMFRLQLKIEQNSNKHKGE